MGIAADLVKSVMEPGVSPAIIRIINMVIVALLATGIVTLYLGLGNVHLYVMMFLALGLCGSINWFVMEMQAAGLSTAGGAAGGGGDDGGAAVEGKKED